MATNDFIRIPTANLTRNENELRSAIDQLVAAQNRLSHISDKMLQMAGTPADYAGVETEYNLTAGDGTTVTSLVASTVSELDAAPFLNQLTSRLG